MEPHIEKVRSYFSEMLPKEDVEDIVRAFAVRLRLKKGECLVVPGQRSTFLAFINSGSFRVHFINHKGEEITTWFSFAGMFVTDLLSYYKDCPAMYYVEALEESEVLVAQKSHLDRLYLERPEYREFGRKFAENGMVLLMERMVSLQTKSAEERYLELLARPEFMKKIPLKHLATYLGITDSSLSRIRKSIY